MPACLFTLHSYRSWNADNLRGYVRYGKGIQPPSSSVAKYYDSRAKQLPVVFGKRHQSTIVWIVWDACRTRDWRLHCVAFEASHVHVLVSWRSADDWQSVHRKLKNLISWALAKDFASEGRRWLVRRGSRRRVCDRRHFDYLMATYLPRHRGVLWKEGDAPPETPGWVSAMREAGNTPASAGD